MPFSFLSLKRQTCVSLLKNFSQLHWGINDIQNMHVFNTHSLKSFSICVFSEHHHHNQGTDPSAISKFVLLCPFVGCCLLFALCLCGKNSLHETNHKEISSHISWDNFYLKRKKSFVEDLEKLTLLCIADENCKMEQLLWKRIWSILKKKKKSRSDIWAKSSIDIT